MNIDRYHSVHYTLYNVYVYQKYYMLNVHFEDEK